MRCCGSCSRKFRNRIVDTGTRGSCHLKKPFPPIRKGRRTKRQHANASDRRQPPRGGSLEIHAWIGVAAGRSSDLQARPHDRSSVALQSNGVSTDPSSRFFGKPVVLGRSFLLTAAGQFRFHTGFPLTFPHETSPAIAPQHKVSPDSCQPKCCAFLMSCPNPCAQPRGLYGVRRCRAAFPLSTPS